MIGPLARSAADLDIALAAMAGPDAIDGAGWKLELPKPKKSEWKQFKVGLMLEDRNSAVDAQVQGRLQALAGELNEADAAAFWHAAVQHGGVFRDAPAAPTRQRSRRRE